MDEGVSIRAITIGVSVFIAVATISAVLAYYNTAKETVRNIGSGTDIAGLYTKSIEDTLLKKKVTGTEVKNILNYFHGKADAKVILVNINYYNGTIVKPGISGELDDTKYKKLIKFMLPNSKYGVSTQLINGITNITIKQE